MSDENRMTRLNLALKPDDAEALTGLIAFAMDSGGPLEHMAARRLSDLMKNAMLAQMPAEARERVAEIIDSAMDDDECPDELKDALGRIREDVVVAPITEAEVAGADVENIIDTTLADSIPPEAIIKSTDDKDPV